jgi:hypothetical protein
MKMNKHLYAGTLMIVFIMMLVIGCVKLPSEAPALPEFKAELRFINAASDVGQASVTVDGQDAASLALGAASDYLEFDAGNRIFKLENQPAETLFVDSDFFGTIFIMPRVNPTDSRFGKLQERWRHTNNLPADSTAGVTVVQMVPDTLTLTFVNVADEALQAGFTGDRGTYWKSNVVMGDYRVTVVSGEDTVKTFTESVPNQADLTFVLYGSATDPSYTRLNNE